MNATMYVGPFCGSYEKAIILFENIDEVTYLSLKVQWPVQFVTHKKKIFFNQMNSQLADLMSCIFLSNNNSQEV